MQEIYPNVMLQIIIAARSTIIAISFFEKARTVIWNDTRWGTILGSGKSTSRYTTLFILLLSLPGMSHKMNHGPVKSYGNEGKCQPRRNQNNTNNMEAIQNSIWRWVAGMPAKQLKGVTAMMEKLNQKFQEESNTEMWVSQQDTEVTQRKLQAEHHELEMRL